jgi:RNA polymerase sigma-70 factor, ECF subfamily
MTDHVLSTSPGFQTRRSLLLRASEGDEAAWQMLSSGYRPFIVYWLTKHSVPQADVDDLTQNVMLSVVRHLKAFEHSGRTGAFRCWLRTITINETVDYRKSSQRRFLATDFLQSSSIAPSLSDSRNHLEAEWDAEHERFVLRSVMALMEMEFEYMTLAAFRGACLEGRSALEVAESLGISIGAVYTAKSRVLQRIRKVIEDLDLAL